MNVITLKKSNENLFIVTVNKIYIDSFFGIVTDFYYLLKQLRKIQHFIQNS